MQNHSLKKEAFNLASFLDLAVALITVIKVA